MDLYDNELMQSYAHRRHDEEIRNAEEARLRHGLTHPTGQHGLAHPVLLLGGLVAAGTLIAAFTLTGGAEAPVAPIDPPNRTSVTFEDTGSTGDLGPCAAQTHPRSRFC